MEMLSDVFQEADNDGKTIKQCAQDPGYGLVVAGAWIILRVTDIL